MSQPARLTELADRAVIAVTGPDWRSFLQGLITQDVETLKPGELRFGALLNPQGRLLYDLFILGTDEGALLDVARATREALAQRLSMYRLRAKVTVAPTDDRVFALWGGPAGPGWAPDPRLAYLGWRAIGAEPPAAAGAETAGVEDYEVHRLSLGVPGAADWSEASYPIEADFDLLNGIDFKKGCFVGQETTSRMKRRGGVKSRTVPLVFDGPAPAAGTILQADGMRGGEILSGRDGGALALVRLDRVLGADLTVEGRKAALNPPDWLELEG